MTVATARRRPAKVKRRPAAEVFAVRDVEGKPLSRGDRVRSTPLYDVDGHIIDGFVVSVLVERGLVTVQHTNGPRAGQRWRATARLWRKVPA